MQTDIQQRFGLNRHNFILNPANDFDCFARDDINIAELVEDLQITLVTHIAPKRLYWGPYGGGKTHTLFKAMHELSKLTDVFPVHVECPDLTKGSTFNDLYHDGIMRSIGQNFMIDLLRGLLQKVGIAFGVELQKKLYDELKDEDFAKATMRLFDPTFEPTLVWAWLSGTKLAKSELAALGQTEDLSKAQAPRLADILINIGTLVRRVHGKTLVLILDEMERIKTVGPDKIQTFVSAFTRLADQTQNDVAMLIGASARQLQTDIPELFQLGGPVSTRLGKDALVEISAMVPDEVEKFMIQVIAYLRDDQADITALVNNAKTSTNETLHEELFPFSSEAVDALQSKLTQLMTPREITINMTKALGRAQLANKSCITSDLF